MDIQYLLTLQNFRESINNAWTPFMEFISMFATTYLILIPVFVYWNRDKKGGLYVLTSYVTCMLITPVIKLTACVYRPWIRSDAIHPAGDSIRTATGYSFPSGHTTTATPLAGGMAVITWKDKKTRWLSFLFVAFVLLTGFSRNYLGVHTPQDVFVAIAVSILILIVTAKVFQYLEKHPEKENWFLLGSFILCWAAILYFNLKSYPRDLDAEGKLIVDPQKMMNDGYGDVGKMMGFLIARFVEKTWIRFDPKAIGNKWLNLALCLVGLVGMVLLKTYFSPVMTGWLGSHWGKLCFSIIYTFYYIALFPLILKWIGKVKTA